MSIYNIAGGMKIRKGINMSKILGIEDWVDKYYEEDDEMTDDERHADIVDCYETYVSDYEDYVFDMEADRRLFGD